MKKLYIILQIVTMLIVASCQATPTPLDPASIQNTAVAMAWTTVSETQAEGLVATVNAQGTQIAILNQPSPTMPSPTFVVTPVNDNNIKLALLATLGWGESDRIYFSTQYNDGQLAIGTIQNRNINVSSTDMDAFWIAQKDNSELWGIIYISRGFTPPCEELQKVNINFSQIPMQCMDANKNPTMLWQWQGQ